VFSEDVWKRNEDIYASIISLPFNVELASGALSEERFKGYIVQDTHYLDGFARSLSLLASKGHHIGHMIRFTESVQSVIDTELFLHSNYLTQFGISDSDFSRTSSSPVCDHYVSYLLRVACLEPLEVGLAAVLPCFWIYREVGKYIHSQAVSPNPYQSWIDTYTSEEFDEEVDKTIAVVDEVAKEASSKLISEMHQAFRRSSQLEWMFWDSAYRLNTWPVGLL